MASIKGIQLLKMPELLKENAPPVKSSSKITKSLHMTMPEKNPHQMLSMPLQQENIAPPKLFFIPGINLVQAKMPLLKLPVNRIPDFTQTKVPGCQQGKQHLPLLTKPHIPEETTLVKIPVQHKQPIKVPYLIQLPLRDSETRQPAKLVASSGEDHQTFLKPKLYSIVQLESNESEINKDNEKPTSQAVKRKRRRRKKPSITQGSNEVYSIRDESATSGDVKIKKKERIRVQPKTSQSTQTTTDTKKKMKDRKNRLNLMALLEQAALQDMLSGSSDEEHELNLLKNRSYLVKEEPYREEPYREEPRYIDSNRANERKKTIPTIEELLLQNFEDHREISPVAQSSKTKFEVKKSENSFPKKLNSLHRTESSTQTFDDIQFSKSSLADRPRFSVGPSWKEISALMNGASAAKIDPIDVVSLKEIGVQVSDTVPVIDKIEQTSQTDFTEESDVASILLQNLREGRMKEVESLTSLARESKEKVEKQDAYPWQFIADTDFSDVMARDKSDLLKTRDDLNKKLVDMQVDRSKLIASTRARFEALHRDTKSNKDSGMLKQESNRIHMPPDVYLGMKFHEDHIEAGYTSSTQMSQPLNIVDISRASSPIVGSDDNEVVESIVMQEIPVEKVFENVDLTDEKVATEAETWREKMLNEDHNVETYQLKEREIAPLNLIQEDKSAKQEIGLIQKRYANRNNRESKATVQPKNLNAILEAGPKDRMHHNLRNMSVQLDALDELYDHLEKELKSSAMLMHTVQTLHHGFLEEPDVFKRKPVERYVSQKFTSAIHQDDDMNMPNAPIHKRTAAYEDIVTSSRVEDIVPVYTSIEERGLENLHSLNFEEMEKSSDAEDNGDVMERDEVGSETAVFDSSVSHGDDDKGFPSDDEQMHSSVLSGRRAEGEMSNKDDEATNQRCVIRQRITEKYPAVSNQRREDDEKEKEMKLKLKLEQKRQALRDWMKKKRSEQNQKYRIEIEEKRQKESKPFVSTKSTPSMSRKEAVNSEEESKTKRKIAEEEIYKDRIDGAQQLLDDILAVNSNAVNIRKSSRPIVAKQETKKRTKLLKIAENKRTQSVKRKLNDSAYKVKNNTRKGTVGGVRQKNGSSKQSTGTILLDNISPSWKYSDVGDEEFLKEFGIDINHIQQAEDNLSLSGLDSDKLEPYTSTARSGRKGYKIDLGSLSDRRTPDHGSARPKSRLSVEGKEFVTEKSMEAYRKKTARLIRQSLKEFGNDDPSDSGKGYRYTDSLTNENSLLMSSGGLNDSEKFMINKITRERNSMEDDFTKESKRQRTRSPNANNDDINGILRQYGLMDDDIDEGVLETSKLLAEADAMLEHVSESKDEVFSTESINWNEIDNILNQD